MKVKVLISFHDVNDWRTVYNIGDVVEFPEKRAEELQRLKIVEPLGEEAEPAKEEVEVNDAPKKRTKKKGKQA